MRILLVGEYNSSHKTLKEGLETQGHDVTVVGLGDGFKKRLVDINFRAPYKSGLAKKFNVLLYKLFGLDLYSRSVKKQFFKQKDRFANYDIVQLINENPFATLPKTERKMLDYIFANNKNVFLLSCGLDHISVKFAMDKKYRYNILTPYFEGKEDLENYKSIVKYLQPDFVDLHRYVFENIKGVIASDMDYDVPLRGHSKYLGMVPNPIRLELFDYHLPPLDGPIVIFHGINRSNYIKKGNYLFEEALEILSRTHADRIRIVTVESVPYDTYIRLFDDAHILLDQVFAYDQGFNALEAMAKGKVAFTGAEKEWLDHFDLKEDSVAINALPDAEKIAEKLRWLVDHPEEIERISKNARAFIEAHHDHIKSAQHYFELWRSKLT